MRPGRGIKVGLLAGLVAVGLSAPLAAQSVAEFEALWAAFEERCGLSASEPASYLASISPDNYHGADPIAQSPDGAITYIRQHFGDYSEIGYFARLGDELGWSCSYGLNSGFEGDYEALEEAWHGAWLEFAANRPDITFEGGPITWIEAGALAGQISAQEFSMYEYTAIAEIGGAQRTISVNFGGTPFIAVADVRPLAEAPPGLFDASAVARGARAGEEPSVPQPSAPTPAQAPDPAVASNFGLAVDLCLQHLRDRNPVDAFRAAGFDVVPMDEGTFDFAAPGVTGFLAPLLVTGWCWVASEDLSYAQAETIAYERALFRHPQGVSGPATRGFSIEIAPGADCSGFSVMQANRITTLIMTNVPFWEGCESPSGGAVLFN